MPESVRFHTRTSRGDAISEAEDRGAVAPSPPEGGETSILRSRWDPIREELSRHPWRSLLLAACALWMAWVVLEFSRSHLGGLSVLLASFTTTLKGALCVGAAWTVGWRLVAGVFPSEGRSVRVKGGLERSLIEIATGLGVLCLGTFLLATVGALHTGAVVMLLSASILCRPDRLLREVVCRVRVHRAAGGAGGWGLALGVLLAQTLLLSLTPATSQDALVYHLAVPSRYVDAGGFTHLPGNFFASFPQHVDLLFAVGLLLDGEVLAKWFHWAFSVGSAAAVVALARRLLLAQGREKPSVTYPATGRAWRDALLAGLVFASIPTAALISTWAYVDLGVVFFSVVSWLAFLAATPDATGDRGDWSPGFLVISAWIAGAAAGTKYTGAAQALFTGVVIVFIATRARMPLARIARRVALYGGVSFLGLLPWLVKNAWFTGNPLFPFAHALFPGADWDMQRAAILAHSLREWGGLRAGWEIVRLPWDLTFSGRFFSQSGFDGVIGAVFLAAAPLALLRARASRAYTYTLVLALLHAGLWVLTTHQVRFLLPTLAFGAALIVTSISTTWIRSIARGAVGIACGVNLLIFVLHFATRNPLPVVCGLESRDTFLARELPGGDYDVFRTLNEELPDDARVLFGSCGNPGFLCRRSYHSDALFENRTLAEILRGAASADEARRRFAERGFTHLVFRFENVFDPSGRRSELPLSSQRMLAELLNRWGTLVREQNGTRLYALLDAPRAIVGDAG